MACRLAGAKPLSEPMLGNCCLDPRNKLQWHLNRNSYIFIQENAFENVVWEMAAILSRPQCVNNLALLGGWISVITVGTNFVNMYRLGSWNLTINWKESLDWSWMMMPEFWLCFHSHSPLRQWCGWNSIQHQTWRRALREEFVLASILCWIELYCFGVRRYFWKCTNKCLAELQTLGGKNSSVFNVCNSGWMLGGKFEIIRGMLGGKFEDAGWKLHERVRKRSK